MQKRGYRVAAILLACAALAAGVAVQYYLAPSPATAAGPTIGGDFTLRAVSGPVKLSDFRGQVVAVYFGYSYCPDACPTSLAYLGLAMKQLGEDEQAQVQPLFISVDPQRDTPQRLAEYSAHFHPRMLGLTASQEQVAAVARQYGVYYQLNKTSEDDSFYGVDHTSRTFVIDRDGAVVALLEHGTGAAGVAAALRDALR